MASLSQDESYRRQGDLITARRVAGWSLAFFVCGLALTPSLAWAQESAQIEYVKIRSFTLRFTPQAGARPIREVRLYGCEGRGTVWKAEANALPTDRLFRVSAPKDGWYWYTVQIIDVDQKAFPARLDQAQVMMKVCVDTRPPSVIRRQLTPQGNGCGSGLHLREETRVMST